MRAVNADDLIHELDKDGIMEHGYVSVFGIPIIEDCVPVVRCKDCKYAYMTDDGYCNWCDIMADLLGLEYDDIHLPGDWFCADGKKVKE